MVVIVKIKIIYSGFMRSETYARYPDMIWTYKDREDYLRKDESSEISLDRVGYKLMRNGKEKDQYVIDMNFKGTKDIIYLAIEKELKPLMRDKILTDLLEN